MTTLDTPREIALRLRVSGYTVTILIGRGASSLDRYLVRASVTPASAA